MLVIRSRIAKVGEGFNVVDVARLINGDAPGARCAVGKAGTVLHPHLELRMHQYLVLIRLRIDKPRPGDWKGFNVHVGQTHVREPLFDVGCGIGFLT